MCVSVCVSHTVILFGSDKYLSQVVFLPFYFPYINYPVDLHLCQHLVLILPKPEKEKGKKKKKKGTPEKEIRI